MVKKHYIKSLDMNVPLLGFGAMRLPMLDETKVDMEQTERMYDYAMANGMNYFDTAYPYLDGQSEESIGKFLTKYPRDSYYITSKLPYSLWLKPKATWDEMQEIFDTQLKRCQTDYFDIYFIHAMQAERYIKMEASDAYGFMKKLKDEGKVKKIGFSFHGSVEFLERVLDEHEWDAVQLQLNFYDWEFQNIKTAYKMLEDRGIPCFVMEPLRGGMFANISEDVNKVFKSVRPDMPIPSWGYRWVCSLPNVAVCNSGVSSMEQLVENLSFMQEDTFAPLNDAEYAAIDKAVDFLNRMQAIPCTGCHYCDGCPKNVDIPRNFEIMNDYHRNMALENHRWNEDYMSKIAYNRFIPFENQSHHCVSCGLCVKKCPQHINIPEELKKITEFLYDPELLEVGGVSALEDKK